MLIGKVDGTAGVIILHVVNFLRVICLVIDLDTLSV
jgi:hypothetical protein